jgi:hypothetical protein
MSIFAPVTFELIVNIGYGAKLHRTCYTPKEDELALAMQSIHTNTNFISKMIERWPDSKAFDVRHDEILAARNVIAKGIAMNMVSHMMKHYFELNDTVDGYTKAEIMSGSKHNER